MRLLLRFAAGATGAIATRGMVSALLALAGRIFRKRARVPEQA